MLNFGGVIKSCAFWENLFTVTNDEVNIIIFQLWIDLPSGLQLHTVDDDIGDTVDG